MLWMGAASVPLPESASAAPARLPSPFACSAGQRDVIEHATRPIQVRLAGLIEELAGVSMYVGKPTPWLG